MALKSANLDLDIVRSIALRRRRPRNIRRSVKNHSKFRGYISPSSHQDNLQEGRKGHRSCKACCQHGRSKGLQAVWKPPFFQSKGALGKDHQGPNDSCSLGSCIGVMHMETPTKTWNSFSDCVMLHLQQVFQMTWARPPSIIL